MPAPAAPTGLTVAEAVAESGAYELTWSHAGGADRFEVLRLDAGETSWKPEIIAPAGDFGSGPYTYATSGTPETQFAVRAINAAGEVSV